MASLFHWPSAPQLWGSVTSYVSPSTPSPKPPTASSTIEPPRLVMTRVSDRHRGTLQPRAMALKPTPTPAPNAPPAAPVSVSLMIVSPLNSPSPRWSPASRPSRAAPDAAPDAAPIAVPMRIVPTGPNAPAVAIVADDRDHGDRDHGDVLPLRTGLAVAHVVERLDRDRRVARRVEEVDRIVGGVGVRRRRRPPCPASATAGRRRGTAGSSGRTVDCRATPDRRPRRRSTRATACRCEDPPPHASATVNGRHVTRPSGSTPPAVVASTVMIASSPIALGWYVPERLVPLHGRLARRLQPAELDRCGSGGRRRRRRRRRGCGHPRCRSRRSAPLARTRRPRSSYSNVVTRGCATGRRLDQLDELVGGVVAELALELGRRLPAQATELVVLPAGVAAGPGAGDQLARRARTRTG